MTLAHALAGDFRAFYCAGTLLAHGVNPYAGAPLYACESMPQPFGLYHARSAVAVPAPLPGYVLLVFAALSVIPYPLAVLLYAFASLLAGVGCAVLLARSARIAMTAAFAALALPLWLVAAPYGETVPFALFGLIAAGANLTRGRYTRAASFLALAAVEPHLALPAILGGLLWERRLRAALAIMLALLALADVAAGGPALALEYVTRVLPAHALAELPRSTQFSLAWVAFALGASPRAALTAGDVSYVVTTVTGIVLGAALARRLREPSLALFLPAALAPLAGVFVHPAQMAFALPAALLLTARTHGAARTAALSAVVLLAVPWLSVAAQPWLLFAVACVTAAFVWNLPGVGGPSLALRTALGAVLCAGLLALALRRWPAVPQALGAPAISPDLTQASWAAYVYAHESSRSLGVWIAKLPTWLGLLSLAFGGALAVTHENGVAGVAVEHAPLRP